MTTFQKLAEQFEQAFTTNGVSDTLFLKDDAPEWIDMHEIHEALDDRMPNDWVYRTVADFDFLSDHETADDARDAVPLYADAAVDIYNSDLLSWLSDHAGNVELADEAAAELEPNANVYRRAQLGQFRAIEALAHAVIDQIEAAADEADA